MNYFDFAWDKLKNKIDLLVCGDSDAFCSLDILRPEAKKISSPLEIISGGDHFYMGREKELAKIMQKYIL